MLTHGAREYRCRPMTLNAPRLRFAPSPSGFLHIGGARTALFCWLLARRHGGSFILRVEDTDQARTTDASIQAILDGLSWLGLDWDEGPGVGGDHGPYFQSERKAIYQEYVGKLIESGHAYRCYCTRDQLDAKRAAAQAAGRKATYDGTCRSLDPAAWDDDEPFVWRLRVPLEGDTIVRDLVRGNIRFPNAELGDMVIVRSNGDPLYNFVVVIDDATMKVSHVVRGDDHLSNTPKQILIYEALGLEPPTFAHLPLILGEDKKRLSKRHCATNVMQYSDEGYLPDAMVNFLARLGWSHGDQELFARDELVSLFSLESVGKAAGVWNPSKLLWTNHQWMMRTPSDQLAALIAPRIEAAGHPDCTPDAEMVWRIDTLKERSKTLVELVDQGTFYWAAADGIAYEPKATRKFLSATTLPVLQASAAALQGLREWTEEAIETALAAVIAELEVGVGKVAQPLRVAVTGTRVSPGIWLTLAALGRDKTLARLAAAIEIAGTPRE